MVHTSSLTVTHTSSLTIHVRVGTTRRYECDDEELLLSCGAYTLCPLYLPTLPLSTSFRDDIIKTSQTILVTLRVAVASSLPSVAVWSVTSAVLTA